MNHNNPQLDALLKVGYRLTPATMATRITNGRWIAAKHLLHISTIVATELKKGGARIIITMPARHGKSEFVSVHTPIWFLDWWPDRNVILTSYGADLSTEFSRKVRDYIVEHKDSLRVRLRADSQRVDRFHTTQGGGMLAAGIGGPITGKGAHLFIIDDYVKNAEDSLSEIKRKTSWEWLKSTALTRLEPNASILVLATRWNDQDLIGKILEEWGHMNWILINLPAFAEENDPLGRLVGEPLWPERYDTDALMEIKDAVGSYWWDAMYQQHPRSSMGGMELGECYKVISSNELPSAHNLKKIRSWDLAASEATGDYTAGPLYSQDKMTGKFYIEDMQHFQKSPKRVETMVAACALSDGPGVPIRIEQEPGSAGKNVIEHYKTEVLSGYSCTGERPTGPLTARASAFLASVEAGNVFIVKGDWNKPLRKETNAFPEGEHDDMIAALAQAHNWIMQGSFGSVIWGEDRFKQSLYVPPSAQKLVRGAVW